MYIRRRCTCIYVFSALPSPHDINFRTDVCVRARVLCVCMCICVWTWKNVCEYVSKEAERSPHCEKGDERVQLEKVEEAGVKRDGKE